MRIPAYPCSKCKGGRFSYEGEEEGRTLIVFTCTNCGTKKTIMQGTSIDAIRNVLTREP